MGRDRPGFQTSRLSAPGYSESEDQYPVVHLTDSDAYFGSFRTLVGHLSYDKLIPEVAVVGIAYEENTVTYLAKRERVD
jgi:predicted alpha/beta superfamily hydrolase